MVPKIILRLGVVDLADHIASCRCILPNSLSSSVCSGMYTRAYDS